MFLKAALAPVFFLFSIVSFAQAPGKITGRILDAQSRQPIEYATITALKEADSTLAGGQISGVDGRFDVAVPFGKFIVRVELMTFKAQYFTALVTPATASIDLGDIKLEPSAEQLQAVEIEGERSQVQLALDKKVFNVERDLSAAGGSALDALENVPSVTVDMDGNVSLRGSQAVRILIDGRPSSLTGISGSDALRSLPANSIESIEIITNPSARYEAEGMAGIINIVMKKQKRQGVNGLFSVGTGYPHNHSASMNLNLGLKKVNFFGNYSGSFNASPGFGLHHRETITNGDTAVFDTENTFDWGGMHHHARAGADWTISPKNTITASAGVAIGTRKNPRTTEYKFYDSTGSLMTHYDRITAQPELKPSLNNDVSLAFKRLLNGKDHAFSADISYSQGDQEEINEITENYYVLDYSDATIPSTVQRSASTDNQNQLTGRADYTRPLGKSSKLETGYRGGVKHVDRRYTLEDVDDSTDSWVVDPSQSNHFIYDEAIHAGYVIYGTKAGKMSYQLGVRVENTNVTGALVETDEHFTKIYTHLFPSAHISREMGKGHRLQLSYSRRINRPSFWNLNPFMSHSDPYNIWAGNPNLNPELTHSLELGDIWYGKTTSASATIYFRHTDSVITRLRILDEEGRATTMPFNLNQEDAVGLEFTLGTSIFKWWKINGSANYFHKMVDGVNLDTSYTTNYRSYSARINSITDLWKGSSLQLMFNYRGPERWLQGIRYSMIFFDVGLKQDVLKSKGTLTLKVIDPLNTRSFRFLTEGPDYTISSRFRRHSRGFVLNFTYKLNNFRMRERERNGGEYQMEEMGF